MSNKIEDKGIIVLMYHRFEENKYPSTNIRMVDFIKHINLIKKNNFIFVDANNFESNLLNLKKEQKMRSNLFMIKPGLYLRIAKYLLYYLLIHVKLEVMDI